MDFILYPHPKLMPTYWQFPTVSMGLDLYKQFINKILNILQIEELKIVVDKKSLLFMGDGECDEPEALGAIGMAAREELE